MPRPTAQPTPAAPAAPTGRERSIAAFRNAAAARKGKRPPNYGKKYPAEVLSDAEFMRLLLACPRSGPLGARNRALLAVLWRSGVRVGEAVALEPKDIDFERKTLTVLRGKGSKRRVLGLDDLTAALIKVWLGVRQALGVDDDDGHGSKPLFCCVMGDSRGRPMQKPRVNDWLRGLAKRANVHKRVHPHGFRHTTAFTWAQAGMPTHQLKALLGHSSLRQTERYLDHLAPIQLIETMSDQAWPESVVAALAEQLGAAS